MSQFASAVAALFSSRRRPVSPKAQRQIRQAIEALESRTLLSTVPNDPLYGLQWPMKNVGQDVNNTTGTAGVDVQAEKAWDITTGSRDVVVAVLDTGMDVTHPDLAANVWTNPGEVAGNGIDDDQNGFVDDVHGWDFMVTGSGDVTDYNGHGTHVAGTIAAVGNNGIGVAGMNWNATVLPVKVLGPQGGSWEAIAAGIEYVTMLKHRGVNIVAANLSIGGIAFPFPAVFDQAVADAGRAGVLLVFAAGNETANNDIEHKFPAKLSLDNPNVITVAATDNRDGLASFSNTGLASVHVGAPGVDIISTWSRDVDDVDNATGNPGSDGVPDGQEYNTISGTSMASPLVAGIIALEAAANPNATPMQLKAALLNSVVITPALSAYYSLPGSVSTGGRVDAYYALRSVQNQFATDDPGTSGRWIGNYGSQGHFVVGADSDFPSFVGVGLTGGAGQMVSASSTDTRMLQNPNNAADHIGAYFTTPDVMTFDMNFTDGQSHRVTLYAADLENLKRTQEFVVIDTASQRILDRRSIADFQSGRYMSWDLSGNVQIQVRSTSAGNDAVVNGFFFDVPPTNPSEFVATDTTTQGRWKNAYGSEGQYIVGQTQAFPGLVDVNLTGGAGQTIKAKAARKSLAMLQRGDDPCKNVMGNFVTPDAMTFDMNFVDGQTHRTAIYVADVEKRGRVERIDVLDGGTNTVINSQVVQNFTGGKYVIFDLSGHVKIRVTRLGGPDAVVSGFFFDAPPGGAATFVGSDRNRQGSWQGIYGHEGAYIAGDPQARFPWFANGQFVNLSEQLLNGRTPAKPALQQIGSLTNREVGYRHTPQTGLIDLDLTDSQTHRVTLYAVDFDKKNRVERIDVIDTRTGRIVGSQEIRDFRNGIYLSWDVRGHVQFRLTRLAGPTAVVSGVFFD